ncbi:MAG: hypothetical protein JW918_16740 [Anaerolineae bacterium]|nr:hypothetical protein [Anaerolineae bacterium]
MAKNGATVLIVARPGPLRDGMQALVSAISQVETAYAVNDLSAALPDMGGWPDLVLLACEVRRGAVGSMVEQARARWPRARCITLVGSVEQQREAELAGADAVALNGLPPQKLLKKIAGMLSL